VVDPGRRLETERLILRTLTLDDFDALYSYQSRSDVARYLYWGPRTEDEVRVALEKKLASTAIRSEEDVLALAVVLKATNEMVGDFILQLLSEEHRVAEIGFIVHPDHHGQGYATEAGRALLGIGFDELKLHRVIGRAEVRNVASARVLEKLGMRQEAHFVENEFVKGEWQSELVYAILDWEWWGRERRSTTSEGPDA
jgi:RimJ/RimL family protein N-acetyltransferase